MNAKLASYACCVEGWSWTYELFADKLIADGAKSEERQHFEFELRHASDNPDRGVTAHTVWFPARLWIVGGVVIFLTAALLGILLAVSVLWDLRLPGVRDDRHLVGIMGPLLFVEFGLTVGLLPYFLKKQRVQRYVTFKRVSDGGPLLTLHSAIDPAGDAFEDFVAETIAAIERLRDTDGSLAHSFKR